MRKYLSAVSVLTLLSATTAYASEVFNLGQIVVSSTRKKPASNVTVITSKQIKESGAQTLGDVLRFAPGVVINPGGKGSESINIRGLGQKDILILIDGVPARETYFRTLDLSQIPAANISEIRIVKGVSSVLYGPDTMGGIINIITKKGTKIPTGNLQVSTGEYGSKNYYASYGGQKGNVNYFLGYAYRKSNGFRLSSHFDKNNPYTGIKSEYEEDGGKRDLSSYKMNALNLKLGYDVKNFKTYLSFDYHHNIKDIPPEYYRFWKFSKWNQYHINWVTEKTILRNVLVKTRLFYVSHKDTINSYKDKSLTQLGGRWFDKSSYDDSSKGARLQLHFNKFKHNSLKFGANYILDTHNERDFNSKNRKGKITRRGWGSWENYKTATYNIALEDDLNIGKFTLIGGIDSDWMNPVKSSGAPTRKVINTINPLGKVEYHITPYTAISFAVAKKTRFPTMKELYSRRGGGNPHLKEQKNTCWEIGVNSLIPGNHILKRVLLSNFYYNVKDLISMKTLSKHEFQYVNIGRSKIYGTEFSLLFKPVYNLNLTTSYTYLHATDEDEHRPIEEEPRHKFDVEATYNFPYGIKVSSFATYLAHQYEYPFNRKTKSETTRKLPNYFTMNLRFEKNIGEHFLWFLQLYNITDRNNDQGHGPEPGRSFLTGLRVRF